MDNLIFNNVEVQSQDLIRVLLQFFKENSLFSTFHALEEETGVSLNTVANHEALVVDITQGRWNSVVHAVSGLRLSKGLLFELYEQIVIELIDDKEAELAKYMVRKTEVLGEMKLEQAERYLRLEHALQSGATRDVYPDREPREAKRRALVDMVRKEVLTLPPSRLLAIVAQSLQLQQAQGVLPEDCTEFDLLFNRIPDHSAETQGDLCVDAPPFKTIKFNAKSKPECCRYAPDSRYMATGTIDGFIEVWDFETGKLARSLAYQQQEEFMMHDDSVLCLAFSADGQYLASGSLDGMLKVWHVKSGKCLRRFEQAHGSGVTCTAFTKSGTTVITGSFDCLIKSHGLKSGKVIKVFRGHQSFVNDVQLTQNEENLVSCSSDGKVRVWDYKSGDCVQVLSPTSATNIKDIAVRQAVPLRANRDHIVVCNASSVISILSVKTQSIVRIFSSDNDKPFLSIALSSQQSILYAASEDNQLYCFNLASGELINKIKVHDSEIIGITHHPKKNLLSTYSNDSLLKIWKSV